MSGRFKFRLATVLRVARVKEEQQRAELAAAQRAAAEAEQARADRQVAYDERPATTGGTVQAFEGTREVIDLRARALREAAEAREAAEVEFQHARDSWMSAARRVKSLEELEDRHYAAHAMVAARAAQRALDDLARARRASHGGGTP